MTTSSIVLTSSRTGVKSNPVEDVAVGSVVVPVVSDGGGTT